MRKSAHLPARAARIARVQPRGARQKIRPHLSQPKPRLKDSAIRSSRHPENPVLVLIGPTASGKSAVALELAEKLCGEIVNADSRQIYKYLDEGTSKPSAGDRKKIPHHLYDFLNPDKIYSAGEYARNARAAIKDIRKRGKTAIVTGGTGLYVRALFEGIAELPERDESVRKEFMAIAESRGRKALHELLEKADPISAKKIPYQNIQRVVRALEVHAITKKPLSEHHQKQDKGSDIQSVKFGLRWDREELKKRIKARTEKMMEPILAETKQLMADGYKAEDPGCQSLGYRQAFSYLGKKLSREAFFDSLLTETYQYAKRQVTWFNREADIHWMDAKNPFDAGAMADKISGTFKEI